MASAQNPVARKFPQLSPALERELLTYCEVTGDAPWDVIADALTMHFDELEIAVLTEPVPATKPARARR